MLKLNLAKDKAENEALTLQMELHLLRMIAI